MTTIKSATNPIEIATIATTADSSKEVRRMLGLSLHGWENAMVVFLIIAGFFALIAGAATWAVVRLQRIEIAESKIEFEKYKLDTAKGISEANARAKEAELKLLELKSQQEPRIIDGDKFREVARDGPKAKVELLYVKEDAESYQLALQVFWHLANAGWDCDTERPIPPRTDDSPYPDKPLTFSVLARDTGISLVVGDHDQLKPGTAYATLLNAFRLTPGQVETGLDDRLPPGTIRIVVAPKPLTANTAPPDTMDTRGMVLGR
jgi:hypothetical protein